MDTRRLTLFFLLSLLFVMGWSAIVNTFFPGLRPKPAVKQPAEIAAADDEPATGDAKPVKNDDAVASDSSEPGEDLPSFPSKEVVLGSLDPESGYFLAVTLASEGAAIRRVELNDPKYRELNDRDKPLAVVGGRDVDRRSFAIYAGDDGPLSGTGQTLDSIAWEVAEQSEDAVTFRLPSINGGPALTKTYSIQKGGDREEDAAGYFVAIELKADGGELDYTWQGPVSIPLENLESTRTFVELKGGFLAPGETAAAIDAMFAGDVVEQIDEAIQYGDDSLIKTWEASPAFVGVDAQYFAALVTPSEGREIDWVEKIAPVIVDRNVTTEHSDVSFTLDAEPLTEAQPHAMKVFFGPKRTNLLDQFGAGDTVDFGFFGSISRVMLALLNFFHHSLLMPYAIAIIMLTCCVRFCMLPISLKMARNAAKMKELQPKIEKLKAKHGDDKEAMMRAQMELFREEDYNMLGGCLPALLQLPIFIGLYQALYNAIDLRLASFLWVDNLAAPDHLFKLPFTLPYFGEWFNLLPLLTCGLYIIQQRMFMPPPATEEAAVQAKMMQFMMVGMGLIFYHVPAGLCLYFIASASWTMSERKLIDLGIIKVKPKKKKVRKPKVGPDGKPTGLMARMMELADEAKRQQQVAEQRKR